MLSERSQSQNTTCHMITILWSGQWLTTNVMGNLGLMTILHNYQKWHLHDHVPLSELAKLYTKKQWILFYINDTLRRKKILIVAIMGRNRNFFLMICFRALMRSGWITAVDCGSGCKFSSSRLLVSRAIVNSKLDKCFWKQFYTCFWKQFYMFSSCIHSSNIYWLYGRTMSHKVCQPQGLTDE